MAAESTPVVSMSILQASHATIATFDWLCVPECMILLDDDMLRDWAPEFAELRAMENENKEAVDIHPAGEGIRRPLTPSSRFNVLTSEAELATFSKGFVPSNTRANTEWAVRNFTEWVEWRCTAHPEDPVPGDILACIDATVLCKWLSLYVIETRRKDGKRYPSSTLNLLLFGLKRHMAMANPFVPNFLDEKDPRFAGLRGARDCVARKLREDGVGASVKQAEIITEGEEMRLWNAGVIGTHSPSALLNAVFFMNGKVLCLRGGREHRMLKLSQFTLSSDEAGEFVLYQENGSKNRSGSYKEKAGSNKIVKHYADLTLGYKCYVHLIKYYFSKLDPKLLQEESSIFYYKPIQDGKTWYKPIQKTWFTKQAVGRNTLSTMVQAMCQKIGVSGKSNHSLRATGATRLFAANIPEKLIQERTGHRSIDALRQYERTSALQQQQVSSVVASPQLSLPSATLKPGMASPEWARLPTNCQLSHCNVNVNINP